MITDNELTLIIQKNIEKKWTPKLDVNADDWFSVEILNKYHFCINKRKEGVRGYVGREYSPKKVEQKLQERWGLCKPIYERLEFRFDVESNNESMGTVH